MKALISTAIVQLLLSGAAFAAEDPVTLLTARNAEFQRAIINVAPNVYTAVGYGVSPTSMIIGDSGLVVIDTQIDPPAATAVLAEFRKITDAPVRAIVLTHGHGDHTGGVKVFAGAGEDVQIWARAGFNSESRALTEAGLTIQRQRSVRQAGFLLDPEQRINNGVARVYYPQRGGDAFRAGTEPTHFLEGQRHRILIAGIELDLVAASGETNDELYVWYERDRVLFSGDNFYKSWPNLYAIRGTPYRDVLAWINSLSSMIDEQPERLVGGHTRPIVDPFEVMTTLTNYRDAIRSIFDQTIEGMNRGLTPDELVQVVELPEQYTELDYLREYYGNIEWSVRAIFSGYLGWFDGNPTNLFPLSPSSEAEKIAALAGGAEKLLHQAQISLDESPQWAAQLCDHLIAIGHRVDEAKRIKADALERLGQALLTTTGRNYYFTAARQLRESEDVETSKRP